MSAQGSTPPEPEHRARKLEKLRDRTDEIELIISGLTTVALFTLPGWLFESIGSIYSHLSVVTGIGGNLMLIMVPGLFYTLGFCFALHLLIRAYWAGLIGLRTVYPDGIRWDKTPGVGPLTQQYYRDRLPDLDSAIAGADRLASSLFAVISMVALGVLWLVMLLLVVLICAGLLGARFGATNQFIFLAFVLLVGMLVGLPLLLWLVDAVIGRLIPALPKKPTFVRTVRLIARASGILWPQRLILPVQLTVQSNTRPKVFFVLLTMGVLGIVFIGQARFAAWTEFSLSSEFRYLDSEVVREGYRSSHYENQRSPRDQVRLLPMIDQFEQQGGFVRLFLPYQPLRDNLILDQLCPEDVQGVACLRQIWSISLNDTTIATDQLLPTERLDLNLRGLTGVIPLHDLEPGIHHLTVVWNPAGSKTDQPIDDRYRSATVRYSIPFLFSPPFERGLVEDTGRTPAPPSDD